MRAWMTAGCLAGCLLGCLVGAMGCGEQSEQVEFDRQAHALLADVRAAEYQDWAPMPGFETRQPSRSPHGNAVDIFINGALADALAASPPWPDGSIVVKDGHDGDRQIGRAIMRKSGGEWFFANFTVDDDLIAAGPDAGCRTCHDDGVDQLLSAPMAF